MTVLFVSVAGDYYPDPQKVVRTLAERGLTRVLLEGGSTLAAALTGGACRPLNAWFRTASLIGETVYPQLQPSASIRCQTASQTELLSAETVGDDRRETYGRRLGF